MKLVAKIVGVAAALALATPALACGDKNTKTAGANASKSEQVAKAGEKKSTAQGKTATEGKPATAAN